MHWQWALQITLASASSYVIYIHHPFLSFEDGTVNLKGFALKKKKWMAGRPTALKVFFLWPFPQSTYAYKICVYDSKFP